ncbi:MAG: secondary thiamine-phosphate synthase enzyme YjbQ [candidate division WOR-3 bacterium]
MKEIGIRTDRRCQILDITRRVEEAVAESGVSEGICILYVPHTTAGITVNEAADPSVASDISSALSKLVPANAGYSHTEGNADSHIKSVLISPSITLIVRGGRLVLGTWQGIFFCEFDGPRSRKLMVKVMAG